MIVFTRQDHVQSQDDHPHIRQVLDGIISRGLWYRLNADAEYFRGVVGTLPPGYIETPANAAVPMGQMKAHAEPVGTSSDNMMAAGHAEMADRIHAGCWWDDLGATMRPATDPDPEVGGLAFDPDAATIRWAPAASAFCYDVLRGDLHGLSDDGASIHLGSAVCLEEDSPDTQAIEASTPPPGRAFYYLVRPNGLHGHFGVGAGGHPRVDSGGACRD